MLLCWVRHIQAPHSLLEYPPFLSFFSPKMLMSILLLLLHVLEEELEKERETWPTLTLSFLVSFLGFHVGHVAAIGRCCGAPRDARMFS
jgi:hypothetical protein